MSGLDQLPPEDDNLLVLRMPSMDSSIAFSEASDSWICPKCSYSNVDSQNERCALCGQADAAQTQKVKKPRKSSWLSLGSFGFNGSNSGSGDFRQPPFEDPVEEGEEEEEDE
eukprot:CAMPEP_0117079888 /NCGR_PEP_ID=MMETSP0472-20121206/56380_1 /TAXON_ID=693140 ORGANISM="Tiarina fusus, Strain LIS" /NCGR_SAMPLE_ID=MMETSP0472 /ASSEMBLY_ACC=CAM_ASM_000603 /LENGTH=111 /DNA_ID=CAMNT_0004807331 /DNA_START=217 /DNA_END=549 /DNA_ORIENTATION=+